MSSSFSGQREWEHRFSYLKKAELDHLYLNILSLAQSKSQILRLYNLLPRNYRVLRNDLIDLQDFWEKYIKQPEKRLIKLSDDYLQWLLAKQFPVSPEKVMKYYLTYLQAKKSGPDDYLNYNNWLSPRILSFADRDGNGYCHYIVQLFQATVGLGCYVSSDKKKLIVTLLIFEDMLDEELTYHLAQLPEYRLVLRSCCGRGHNIELLYGFDLTVDILNTIDHVNNKGSDDYVMVCDSFLSLLAATLKQHGIPLISKIIPMDSEMDDRKLLCNLLK